MERKRIDYFDALRVLSMFGVIFMHIAAAPLRNGIGRSWIFFQIPTSFFFIAVPVFFMISGALLLSDERTGNVDGLYVKRILKLAVPLLVWSALTIFSRQTLPGADFSWSDFFWEIVTIPDTWAVTPLWFMYTLLPIYVLAPFLKTMVDGLQRTGHHWLIVLIIVIDLYQTMLAFSPAGALKYIDIDLCRQLFLFQGYLGFFLLGYYLHAMERRIGNLLLGIVAVLDLALIVAGTWLLSVRAGEYVQKLNGQNLFFTGLLAVCVFLLLKQNYSRFIEKKHRLKGLLRWLSPLSFGVYLMHGLVLQRLPSWNIEIAFWQDALIGLAVTMLLCTAASFVLASIRPLCFPCTGLSWQTACGNCNVQSFLARKRGK